MARAPRLLRSPLLLALSGGILLMMSASVMASPLGSRDKEAERQAQSAAAVTQVYVDQQMNDTLGSIDKSLSTLLQIERGGEGPRRPQPLGATVAGAASPVAHPATTAAIAPAGDPAKVQRPAITPTPIAAADLPPALRPAPASILDRSVQVYWTGTPDALLGRLASQIGFSFQDDFLNDTSLLDRRRVRLDSTKGPKGERPDTVRGVLEALAQQVDSIADIHVSLEEKTIHLRKK